MENSSALNRFLKYISLSICGMMALSFYILIDTFFVAQSIGTKGLAALNIAIPAYSFMHGSGLMIGMGGATKYSICKGQNDEKNANIMFTNTLYIATVLSIFFVTIGLFFSEEITYFLGANEETFELTHTYIRTLYLFSPAFMFNNTMVCFVRNDTNPKLAMLAVSSGSLMNAVFDYVFMFPFDMGMLGAVLATGFSPIVSLIVMSKYLLSKKRKFRAIKTKPSIRNIKQNLMLGFPSLLEQMSSGIVIIVFNIIILSIRGNVGVAAYGVIANMSLVVCAIYTGIAQGIQPLVSDAYGRNDIVEINKFLKYALIFVAISSIITYALVFGFANEIAYVFNNENNMELQKMAVEGLKLYFVAIPFVGFNIISSIYFTSIEKVIPAHIISVLRGFVAIIPSAYILSKIFQMQGVWISFPAAEIFVSIIGVIMHIKYIKR